MQPIMYKLGQSYPDAIPTSEGAIAELLRPTYNELFIALPDISHQELNTFIDGRLIAKLHYDPRTHGLIIVFTFDHQGHRLTFDCPFDASLISDINLQSFTDSTSRLAVSVVVVDSNNNNTIVNLRYITMSVEMTLDLIAIAQCQISTGYSPSRANAWVNSQRALYSSYALADLPIQEYELGLSK